MLGIQHGEHAFEYCRRLMSRSPMGDEDMGCVEFRKLVPSGSFAKITHMLSGAISGARS